MKRDTTRPTTKRRSHHDDQSVSTLAPLPSSFSTPISIASEPLSASTQPSDFHSISADWPIPSDHQRKRSTKIALRRLPNHPSHLTHPKSSKRPTKASIKAPTPNGHGTFGITEPSAYSNGVNPSPHMNIAISHRCAIVYPATLPRRAPTNSIRHPCHPNLSNHRSASIIDMPIHPFPMTT